MRQRIYTFVGRARLRAWVAAVVLPALVAGVAVGGALAQETPRRPLGPPIKLEPLEPDQQPDPVNPGRRIEPGQPTNPGALATPDAVDPNRPPPGKTDESVRIEELPPLKVDPDTAPAQQPPAPRGTEPPAPPSPPAPERASPTQPPPAQMPPATAQPAQPRVEPPATRTEPPPPAQKPSPDAAPADPAVDSAGTLEPGKAGFSVQLWQGVGRDRALTLMTKLPSRSNSSVVRQLTRRLLLTAAPPPQGLLAADNFLSLRAERLYAMGALEDVRALLAKSRPATRDELRARIEIESLLLLGERQAACAAVDTHMKIGVTVFLERASATCFALTGQSDKALLAMRLLRERNVPEADDAFDILIDAQQAASVATLAALPNPTPLHIALLTRSKLLLPASLNNLRDPASLRAIAIARNEPIALRLELAERAAATGALSPARLAEIYAAQTLPEAQTKHLPTTASTYSAPGRAAFYQHISGSKHVGERLGLLATWWRIARARGDAAVVARVTAPLLKDVPADSRYAPLAADVARNLYWAGDPLAATVWFRVMQNAAFRNVDQYTQLAPIAKLAAGDSVTWTADELDAWVAAQTAQRGEAARDRVRLLYVLMAAADDGRIADPALRAAWSKYVPEEVAGSLTTLPRGWRALRPAVEAGRTGEVLLLVLTGLGDERIDKADPAVLFHAIVALRRIGLKDEARQLATEAALAAGL